MTAPTDLPVVPNEGPVEHRFWSKVNKSDGCWLWTGANVQGYGAYHYGTRHQVVRAHRHSWTLTHGPIPDGMHVLHRCDTPACVRPDHLFLGDHAANMADAAAKGRFPSALRAAHQRTRMGDPVIRAKALASLRLPRPKRMVCKRGHALTGYNEIIRPNGRRTCRTCKVAHTREWRRNHA